MVVVVLLGVVAMAAALGELAASLRAVAAQASGYGATAGAAVTALAARLGLALPVDGAALVEAMRARVDPSSFLRPAASAVLDATAFCGLVLLYALFMLAERRSFDARLHRAVAHRSTFAATRELLDGLMAGGERYVAQKTLVNVVLAAASALVLWACGIEHVLLWSTLIGVLNYVPYIGSIVAVAFPAAYALGQTGDWGTTGAMTAGLVAAQLVTGSWMEPRLFSHGANLSGTVVLAAVALWGALWGLWGAILAVPLTAAGATLLAQTEWGRPWAILLSRTGVVDGPPARGRDGP